MVVKIGYSKRANLTHGFAILAEGWNELVQDGFTPDGVAQSPVLATDEVLYAVSTDGDIVGALAFRAEDEAICVHLSYVEPSSRRRGIYQQMFEALLSKARERGTIKITSEVAFENRDMQAVMRRTGRSPVATVFEMTVKPAGGEGA
jgi:GNAT superfamily N-acetyltransferase